MNVDVYWCVQCMSQFYIHAATSVYPTQLSVQSNLRLISVRTELKRSTSAPNLLPTSSRRQLRSSAPKAHASLWNCQSTVGLQFAHWQTCLWNNPTPMKPANTNSSFKRCVTVRAKPPVKLSFDNASDEGWRLTWSSPYPLSSSLNKNITYEISYRKDGESDWTVSVK